MKLLPVISVFAAVASALGQTIAIGFPTNGTVLQLGKNFTAQIVRPTALMGCTEVGIALAIANCNGKVCPQPAVQLGSVLYAGSFAPTTPTQGGFYQNFSVQVPAFMTSGASIFTLTHLCLLGAGPSPLLEFRNVSVTLK
ncbi:hypothetical protein HD554DRAFT_2045851 [Boletus coccyginus]|nr:hypothetical protein HD554DRAFT_2045851 [Boletus coccyginus]